MPRMWVIKKGAVYYRTDWDGVRCRATESFVSQVEQAARFKGAKASFEHLRQRVGNDAVLEEVR